MSSKKVFSFIIFCLVPVYTLIAQDQKIADSLALVYEQETFPDSVKIQMLATLSFNEVRDLPKGVNYAEQLIKLAEQTGNKKHLRSGYFLLGTKKRLLGDLDEALAAYFKSAALAKELKNPVSEGESYGAIGDTYANGNNYSNATTYYDKAIDILRKANNPISLASYLSNAGDFFRKTNRFDSALLYFEEAKRIFEDVNYQSGIGYSLGNIGMVYASTGRNLLAEKNMNEAIAILEKAQDYYPICDYLTSMADVYLSKGNINAATNAASRSLRLAEQHGLVEQIASASLKLSEIFEKNPDKKLAFAYFKKHIEYRDSINNLEKVQKMADLRTNYEVAEKQTEVNLLKQEKRNQRNLAINLGIILALSVVILAILITNAKSKQRAFTRLALQKKETDEQRSKAEAALAELQLTQKQLVQSAKMVSLGELTAGIAHEIQNPLNFVNNFSELNVELLKELKETTMIRMTADAKDEAEEIFNILSDNMRKISDHGKRADGIVKGMLQHSRANTDKKEPTDINALITEYQRLSYHGVRVKNKNFRVRFESSLDKSIGLIEVVPQDIGRVLLNIYNNAFYAVNKKHLQAGENFEPVVSVTTERVADTVEISIADNGIGIPKELVDKIYQPFFTTKPTGQGTGLGLSLSYDIIYAHGGNLKVETEEGKFTKFTIVLPIGNS